MIPHGADGRAAYGHRVAARRSTGARTPPPRGARPRPGRPVSATGGGTQRGAARYAGARPRGDYHFVSPLPLV